MITVGVDLAAEAAGTAVATIEWRSGLAEVVALVVGADDGLILDATVVATKVGLDCPVGWPVAFVEFVGAHAAHRAEPPESSGREWRRSLTSRRTDTWVHAHTGLTPLSVSADLIGHTALRWAAISARLALGGTDVRRDGAGLVAEVYPSAALKVWGLRHRRYKRSLHVEARAMLVEDLARAAPWLRLGGFADTCLASDDAFDAVVCALVARAVVIGGTTPPDRGDVEEALEEGWIHVPSVGLEALPHG